MLHFFRLVIIVLTSIPYQSFSKDVLYVGTGTSTFSNRIYLPLYQDFEAETGIKIIRVKLDDIQDLDNDAAWYTYNNEPIDVINGQATRRLQEFYKKGNISPINTLWEEADFDKSFGHLKPLVSYKDKVLGMPFNVYGWQMFYLKSQVGDSFKPPETLNELALMCKTISEKGGVAFHLMNSTYWTEMAWFEYITLRTHGLEYFNELMQGKHSYESKKVQLVLRHWKTLVDAGCYSEVYGNMNWRDAIHFFFRKKFTFMFTGNTLTTFIRSDEMKNNIVFFPFPKIANIPRYESAPTNAYLVNKLSKKEAAIKKFLLFMARPEIQENITRQLGCMPANSQSRAPLDPYANQISKIISQAAGTSAFIDRLLLPKFELESRPHFEAFIKTGKTDPFMKGLESLRLKYYVK